MSRERKNRIIDGAVFLGLLAAVSAVTFVLFYRQTLGNPGYYPSDMKAYILEMQGLDSGYSFPYPVFFKLSAFIHLFAGAELSVAVAATLLNSMAVVITKISFNHMLLSDDKHRLWESIAVSLLTVSLFFISMLYPPSGIYLPGIKFIYLGVFSPNPFHNATYMAARPFAILAFLWYVKLLQVYEGGLKPADGGAEGRGAKLIDYILFSVFLLAATMTKPSFTLVMVSTAGLVMLYRLFCSGFRNFLPTVQLGLTFIPTFLDLLYQYKGVFVPQDGEEGGIGFSLGEVWSNVCDNIPLAICLLAAFPLLVLVLNFKELKTDTLYRFSWQLFLVSLAETLLLYEKGFRKFDFNFAWGYMYGAFFCHMGSLLLLCRKTRQVLRKKKGEGQKDGPRRLLIAAQWLTFLGHLVCGIWYFRKYMLGETYI